MLNRKNRILQSVGMTLLIAALVMLSLGCFEDEDDVQDTDAQVEKDPTPPAVAQVEQRKPLTPEQVAALNKAVERKNKLLKQAYDSMPEGGEKTLSPYFFVLSEDPSSEQLPLKSTRADVRISGVIAQVNITQVYKNSGEKTIEAIYIFPTSSQAALYAMKMTIGERTIIAKIREREQARQEYEQAKEEGKTASLLEQQRPNVFQMNVANILPGDEIKVELQYTELLVPDAGVYEFVYPAVVGPRYSNVPEQNAPDTEKWVQNPYTKEGEQALYTFGLDLDLISGLPIGEVTCPSHDIKAEFSGPKAAAVHLPESTESGNRDFVLKYRLAGDKIEGGLLLYPGEKENFFLLMMEPPKRVAKNEIVPREYTFILDVSGSMHGFPINTSKTLMRELFSKLRPTDSFNVMLFSGNNSVLSEKALPATQANLDKAMRVIDQQRGGGGTELVPAMKRAMALPRIEGLSRILIPITDGYVSVEKEVFQIIAENLNETNVFSFGIGSSVNRFLIEGMARAGMGEPFILLDATGAKEKVLKFRDYIQSPVLQGIQSEFNDFDAYDVEPIALPDLFAEKPVILFGKYRGSAKGAITITGRTPKGEFKQTIQAKSGTSSKENEALRYLWARHRILRLSDMNKLDSTDERKQEVTKLGLDYNLMTEFTSFVAIDSLVRATEKGETVTQPLPLPQGVGNLAVGASMGGKRRMLRSPTSSRKIIAEEASIDVDEAEPAPVKAPVGKVTLLADELTISGDWNKKKVMKALLRSRPKLKLCYEDQLATNPKLGGKVVVEIKLDEKGQVQSVAIIVSGLGSVQADACILEQLKKVRFPKPGSAKPATIRASFSFEVKK